MWCCHKPGNGDALEVVGEGGAVVERAVDVEEVRISVFKG
jgi:hypothetical protein